MVSAGDTAISLSRTNSNLESLNRVKFSFGGMGVLWTKSNPKSQPFWQFSFQGRGCGVLVNLDTTFHKYLSGALKEFWAQNFHSLVCSCIADSLSHTMCVETNKPVQNNVQSLPTITHKTVQNRFFLCQGL